MSDKVTKTQVLGIAGIFMDGIAQFTKAMYVQVMASDKVIYPTHEYPVGESRYYRF